MFHHDPFSPSLVYRIESYNPIPQQQRSFHAPQVLLTKIASKIPYHRSSAPPICHQITDAPHFLWITPCHNLASASAQCQQALRSSPHCASSSSVLRVRRVVWAAWSRDEHRCCLFHTQFNLLNCLEPYVAVSNKLLFIDGAMASATPRCLDHPNAAVCHYLHPRTHQQRCNAGSTFELSNMKLIQSTTAHKALKYVPVHECSRE